MPVSVRLYDRLLDRNHMLICLCFIMLNLMCPFIINSIIVMWHDLWCSVWDTCLNKCFIIIIVIIIITITKCNNVYHYYYYLDGLMSTKSFFCLSVYVGNDL